MSMRKTKVASPCAQATRFSPNLGKHFLEIADEARVNGDKKLAIHFIELAMEVFREDFGQHCHVMPVVVTADSDVLSSFTEV